MIENVDDNEDSEIIEDLGNPILNQAYKEILKARNFLSRDH